MSKILKYIFKGTIIAFSVLLTHVTNGQSLVLPSAVRIGTDVIMVGESAIKNGRQKFEITGDLDIYKYFITADYGWSQRQIMNEGFDYTNSGNYGKIGIDYNFIFSDEDDHVIYYGLRYARSYFTETIDYTIEDDYFGAFNLSEENPDGKARWLEMNVGLKAKIWKQFYIGWTGRFKFAKKATAGGDFSVYEIPGYGLAANKSGWGFNYYIYYRFPFRKKPRILPKQIEEPIYNEDEEEQL
ncbi:DUF6048 family protein [Bacteroidota bacterium]